MDQKQILKLELTVEEINVILQQLQEAAFKVAQPIIAKIVEQTNEQLKTEEVVEDDIDI
jgi:CRISPR/Cas system endoribonuclease Cas6 (RAMP superfamily)